MDKEYVWWSLVNSSTVLIERIKAFLEDGKNVFFCCESPLPWRETLYKVSGEAINKISSQRSLRFLTATDEEPGRYVMENMCPEAVRAKYWPDKSYASFLAEQSDLVLNKNFVWIKGIKTEEQLSEWFKFVSDFQKSSKNGKGNSAQFILEYNGNIKARILPKEIESVFFAPTYLDRYVFCLSILSDTETTFTVKQYIADLVSCLGKEDTELCGRLIEFGEDLILKPTECVKKSKAGIADDEIKSRILTAQIKTILPIIEQYRMQFVKINNDLIEQILPFKNAYGETVSVVSEMELSDLVFISGKFDLGFEKKQIELLRIFRQYRNKIAHNTVINGGEVMEILRLEV